MTRMTATEAARTFSDVLNRVSRGEEVEVTRSGVPVAVIGPPTVRLTSATRFLELLSSAPSPDAEFAHDLSDIRKSVGSPADPWRS